MCMWNNSVLRVHLMVWNNSLDSIKCWCRYVQVWIKSPFVTHVITPFRVWYWSYLWLSTMYINTRLSYEKPAVALVCVAVCMLLLKLFYLKCVDILFLYIHIFFCLCEFDNKQSYNFSQRRQYHKVFQLFVLFCLKICSYKYWHGTQKNKKMERCNT